ncbi:MAG: GyrI-like domain-containing protein [Chlorobium phaeobacteroides]|jgi:effector-binding domain-containing protein|nr:GyrI-like domain-containing protein [Chlorobium phaeobacteroides]
MDFECAFVPELLELTPIPAVTIKCTTTVAAIPALFDSGYRRILEYLKQESAGTAGPPFAIYTTLDSDDIDVEFGFPVTRSVAGSGSLTESRTPSGKAVSILFIGPYEDVEPAYDALLKWVADNNLTAGSVAYEVYLSDPKDTLPEMQQTRIHLLLEQS